MNIFTIMITIEGVTEVYTYSKQDDAIVHFFKSIVENDPSTTIEDLDIYLDRCGYEYHDVKIYMFESVLK